MFLLNGHPLALDTPFTTEDGTQYPANWIRLASSDEKAAIGITEVNDPERFDERFYYAVGVPKELEPVKQMLIDQVRQTAYTMLQPTDYKIIRSVETQTPVNADILTARSAIRTACNNYEAAIGAATSVDELAAMQFAWPTN